MIIILYRLATEVTSKIVHLLHYMYSSNFLESIVLVGVTLLLRPTFYTHFGRFLQEKTPKHFTLLHLDTLIVLLFYALMHISLRGWWPADPRSAGSPSYCSHILLCSEHNELLKLQWNIHMRQNTLHC